MIFASSFSHLRSVQPHVISESTDGVEYIWLKTNSYKKNGVYRVLNIFVFLFKLFTKLGKRLKSYRPELIIASSTFPIDIIPAKYFAKKFKAKLCYEVKDLWPLSLIELGGYSKRHPFIMLMQFAENFAYKKADYVISTLPNTLSYMIEHGLSQQKFCYIPNGIDLQGWEIGNSSTDSQQFIEALKVSNKIVVGYLGGHAISNALDTLVDVAALAMVNNKSLFFVLIGDGTEKQRLINKAKSLRLDNIKFLNPVNRKDVPSILSAMDILYIGWQNTPIYRFGISPNKLMDYMMSGKPVIHSVNAANDIIYDSGAGVSVSPDDPKLILEAITKVACLGSDERQRMGSRGKEYVMKYHNYEILAKKFIDFCDQSNL